MTWEASGAAGEWVVARIPVPEPKDEISFRYDLAFRTDPVAAEREGALLLLPSPVERRVGGLDLLASPAVSLPLARDFREGEIEVEGASGSWSDVGNFTALVLAAGANAPWRLQVTLTLQSHDGPTPSPDKIVRGDGIHLHATDLPRPGVGLTELRANLSAPGWSHLQIHRERLQPVAHRVHSVSFPSGHGFAGARSEVGFDAYESRARVGTLVGGVGALRDAAGAFFARVTHAEASVDVRLRLVSLEGAHVAWEGTAIGYETWSHEGGLRERVPPPL